MTTKSFKQVEIGDLAETYTGEITTVLVKGIAKDLEKIWNKKLSGAGFEELYEIYDKDTECIIVKDNDGDSVLFVYDHDGAIVNEKPKVKLVGENGNIFNLMSLCTRALKKDGQKTLAKYLVEEVTKSNSYDEALSKLSQYCETY